MNPHYPRRIVNVKIVGAVVKWLEDDGARFQNGITGDEIKVPVLIDDPP